MTNERHAVRRVVAVAGMLATVAAVTVATEASAAHIACGTTITQDTVLHSDIGPCAGGGIVIGADNITLDLGGHRVFGTPDTFDGIGVWVFRHTGVTVTNGTVSGFDIGVAIEGGGRNTVSRVVAEDNYGLSGRSRGGDGIAILSSSNNRVLESRAIDNGPFSGIGIYSRIDNDHPRSTTGISSGNLIAFNEVLDNARSRSGVPSATDNDGIRMENDGRNNRIIGNVIRGSGLDGIAVFADNFGHEIRGNVVSGSGFFRTTARRGSGIIVFNRSQRIVIDGNTVTGNADNGIVIRGPIGANVPGATRNTVRGNTATGNSALPAIPSPVFGPTFDLTDGNPACDANKWLGNTYGTASQACVTVGGNQV